MNWTDALEWFEGRVPHCYLDGAGVVTVGVGHAMPSREEAVVVFADPGAARDSILSGAPQQPPKVIT